MIGDDQFETVVELIEATLDGGATVEIGGKFGVDLGERVFEPTVLWEVTPDMPAAKEQTFGPRAPIIPVSDFDEAIKEA
jgi:lactaldehyde dehydrogenase